LDTAGVTRETDDNTIQVPSRQCAPLAGPRLSRLRELNRRLAPAGPDGGWTADSRYRRRRAAPAR